MTTPQLTEIDQAVEKLAFSHVVTRLSHLPPQPHPSHTLALCGFVLQAMETGRAKREAPSQLESLVYPCLPEAENVWRDSAICCFPKKSVSDARALSGGAQPGANE